MDEETLWHAARRQQAIEYLDSQGVKHGRLGDVPALFLVGGRDCEFTPFGGLMGNLR
jgi:hypothetical protein